MEIEKFDSFSLEKTEDSPREIGEVIDSWAKMMELTHNDFSRQAKDGANMFNDKKIDKLDPSININFWLKYGVRYWHDLEGEVIGKTLNNIQGREKIKISSSLAKSSTDKLIEGESVESLTKNEQVSLLVLTKAKILAVEKTASDVYPYLTNEFEECKREIDRNLMELLVDKKKNVGSSNGLHWIRTINYGRGRIPVVLTVISLVLAAASGGVGIVSANADNLSKTTGETLTVTGDDAFNLALLEDRIGTSTPDAIILSPEERQSQAYLYDTKYGSDIYIYNEPWIQEKLARFKEEYGISIVNPLSSVDSDTGEVLQNTPWSPSEIAVLIDEISMIPPIYLDRKYEFFPKAIVLFKVADSYGGAGGLAQGTSLSFFIPSDFELSEQKDGEIGSIFGTSEKYLRSVISHEWTHNHQVNSPKFHLRWESEMGWIQDQNGNWKNDKPDKFVVAINGESRTDPQEDQATSIQIFRFNPGSLSDSRREFIIKSFPDWQPVIDYLEEN